MLEDLAGVRLWRAASYAFRLQAVVNFQVVSARFHGTCCHGKRTDIRVVNGEQTTGVLPAVSYEEIGG